MARLLKVNAVSEAVQSQCNDIVTEMTEGENYQVILDEGDNVDEFRRGLSEAAKFKSNDGHLSIRQAPKKSDQDDTTLSVRFLSQEETAQVMADREKAAAARAKTHRDKKNGNAATAGKNAGKGNKQTAGRK